MADLDRENFVKRVNDPRNARKELEQIPHRFGAAETLTPQKPVDLKARRIVARCGRRT